MGTDATASEPLCLAHARHVLSAVSRIQVRPVLWKDQPGCKPSEAEGQLVEDAWYWWVNRRGAAPSESVLMQSLDIEAGVVMEIHGGGDIWHGSIIERTGGGFWTHDDAWDRFTPAVVHRELLSRRQP